MVCLRKGEKSLREEKSVCGKGKDLLTQMSKCAYGSPEASYAETKRFTYVNVKELIWQVSNLA